MRVNKEFSVDEVKVSIFYMNQKFILKFETANLEQTYKLSELDFIISGEDQLEQLIRQHMIEKVKQKFTEMKTIFDSSFSEISL